MWTRCLRFVGETIEEREESRLLARLDLDVVDLVAVTHEEQRLPHEDREERAADADQYARERVMTTAAEGPADEAPRRPAEPAGEREIRDDEEQQPAHREPRMRAIARRRLREILRNGRRAGGIGLIHR